MSGTIFFVVGAFHLFRILYHWPVQIGPWSVPGWASYVGFAVACGLGVWAFRLGRK